MRVCVSVREVVRSQYSKDAEGVVLLETSLHCS